MAVYISKIILTLVLKKYPFLITWSQICKHYSDITLKVEELRRMFNFKCGLDAFLFLEETKMVYSSYR
jgi:hypothetical protein